MTPPPRSPPAADAALVPEHVVHERVEVARVRGEVVVAVGREPGCRRSPAGRARSPRSRRPPAARRCAPRSAASPASRGRAGAGSRRRPRARRPARRRRGPRHGGSRARRVQVGHERTLCFATAHDGASLRPDGDRAALAARVGRRAHVGGLQRRRRARRSPTCSRCCPYPSGEPHIGHLKVYSVGDARRALPPPHRPAGAAPDGLRRVRPAGREPRDQDRRAPARLDRRRRSREFQRQFRQWGISIDWSREFGTHEPALLPLDAVDLPAALRARPGLPQGGARSSGARTTRPCSPTSRSSTGAASAAATRSRSASSSSGSSASPTTPTGCSTTSTRSSGPSTSRRCSATGSAAREGAEVDLPLRGAAASTTPSSRRARTRCSARRSS